MTTRSRVRIPAEPGSSARAAASLYRVTRGQARRVLAAIAVALLVYFWGVLCGLLLTPMPLR